MIVHIVSILDGRRVVIEPPLAGPLSTFTFEVSMLFVENILQDVAALGIQYERLTYTSDYFPQMQDCAEKLIQTRVLYADDTPQQQMRDVRHLLCNAVCRLGNMDAIAWVTVSPWATVHFGRLLGPDTLASLQWPLGKLRCDLCRVQHRLAWQTVCSKADILAMSHGYSCRLLQLLKQAIKLRCPR